MAASLKVGDRLFNSDQLVSALVQYKLLEGLVGQVILDEALLSVTLSREELFYTLMGSTNSPVPEDFNGFLMAWCQQQGITPAYFEAVVLRNIKIEKFKQIYFSSKIESTFLTSKSTFDQVEYSLIQLTDPTLAAELYFQIRDDKADFAQLAQCYSLGEERYTGGWVGPVTLSTLPIEVANLFRQVEVGMVCEPLTIADRVWLVRLERLLPARLTPATHAQLVNQLYTEWLQAKAKELIATPGAIEVLGQAEQAGQASQQLAAT
ncbi:hypothetical protein IFO70_08690 [Phormidium tenue FACHB-886]|nr:hypothetical protein [Phormidium tenue FACHB-886]